jgi:hypothetical protein
MTALWVVHEHCVVSLWDQVGGVVVCVADTPDELEAIVDLSCI